MNRKTYFAILTIAAGLSQLLYADNDVYDNTTVTENFINASLVDSSWYKTIASGVKFTGSNLTNANFNSATLNDTDFTDTNLTNANFTKATLTGADLSGAEIRGAKFANATGFTSEMLCSTASYANKDLSGVYVSYVTIDGVNFDGVNLNGASFSFCTISNVDFTKTATPNFNLTLQSSTLSNVNFTGLNLEKVELYGVTYGEGVNYTDVILPSGSAFLGEIPTEVLMQTWNYKSGTLNLALTNNKRIDGLDLEGFRVNCNFSNSSLKNINFKDADLTGSEFDRADVSGADFTDAIINDVWMDNSNFTSQQLESTKSYKQKDLSGVTMMYLDNISFEGKDLSGFDFSGARFDRVNFRNAILEDAIINDVYFYAGSADKDITLAQVMQTKSYKDKDLSGATFNDTVFENADFSGFNMQRTMFGSSASNLFKNVNFTNADLRGAGGIERGGWDTATFKNTILKDGSITALEMDSPDDYILVREYKYTDYSGTIYAKFAEDASISGGATVILDNNARLMVNKAVTVNVEDGGIVSYNMDVANTEDESYIYVLEGGDLNFAEGSKLNINVDGDLEAYTEYYKYILYADNTSTLDEMYNDILELCEREDVYFTNNGEELNGDWYFFEKGKWLVVSYTAIPEPAVCAAILGVLALAFAAHRRRK